MMQPYLEDEMNKWLSKQAEALMDLKPLQEFENVVRNQHTKMITNKGLQYMGHRSGSVISVNKVTTDNNKWMWKLWRF